MERKNNNIEKAIKYDILVNYLTEVMVKEKYVSVTTLAQLLRALGATIVEGTDLDE
jgi:hypothetical protein